MSYNNGTVKVKLTDGADMGDDDMPMYRAMYRTMRGLLNRRDANMFVIGFWCGQNPEVAADMFLCCGDGIQSALPACRWLTVSAETSRMDGMMARSRKWTDEDRWAFTHERLRAHTVPARSRHLDRQQAIEESWDDVEMETDPSEDQ